VSRVRTDTPIVPLALVPDQLRLSSLSLRFVAATVGVEAKPGEPAVPAEWTVEQLERIADALDTCRGALDG
jgi:hypothetical protein